MWEDGISKCTESCWIIEGEEKGEGGAIERGNFIKVHILMDEIPWQNTFALW
jgi:hypothetical protein